MEMKMFLLRLIGGGEVFETVLSQPDIQKQLQEGEGELEYGSLSIMKEMLACGHPMTYMFDQDGSLRRLLELLLECSHLDITADAALVYKVIGELLSSIPISESDPLLAFVEEKELPLIAITRQGGRKGNQARLMFLRVFNTFMGRLSKSTHTRLCGRVLLIMSRILPLTERGGFNVNGKRNVANVTPVADEKEGGVGMEGQGGDDHGGDMLREKTNYAFYKRFWGLQKYFQDPLLVLSTEEGWDDFKQGMEEVLSIFEEHPVKGSAETTIQSFDENHLHAKYLTAPSLLSLQIMDVDFRKSILIQAGTVVHFCLFPPAKHAAAAGKMKEEIDTFSLRLKVSMLSMPQGKNCYKLTKLFFERENNWVEWRKGGCKGSAFEEKKQEPEPQKPTEEEAPVKRAKFSFINHKVKLGSEELNTIWNSVDDNAEALEDDHAAAPVLRDFLDTLHNQLNDAETDKSDYVSNDAIFSWKALRLLSRNGEPWPLDDANMKSPDVIKWTKNFFDNKTVAANDAAGESK